MASSTGMYDSLLELKEGTDMDAYHCRLLEVHQPIIERMLTAVHILLEIAPFISENNDKGAMNKIRRVDKSDGNSKAVDELLKEITSRKKQGWFRGFMNGLRNADFEVLADIIEGHKDMKNVDIFLNLIHMPDFAKLFNDVNPKDIMTTLTETNTISKRDSEEIDARITQDGQTAGMELLLERITRHREEWFIDLMLALRRTGQEGYIMIVNEIEPKLAKVCVGQVGKVAEHLNALYSDPQFYTGAGSSMVSQSMETSAYDEQETRIHYKSYTPHDTPLDAPNPQSPLVGDRSGPDGRETSPVPANDEMQLDIRGTDQSINTAIVQPMQAGNADMSSMDGNESFTTARPSLTRQTLVNQQLQAQTVPKGVMVDGTNPTLAAPTSASGQFSAATYEKNAYFNQNNLSNSIQHVKPPLEKKVLNITNDLTARASSLAPAGPSTPIRGPLPAPSLPESYTPPDESNSTIASQEIKPEELKLRSYQEELARRAMEGDNVVIVAPTGSGKTHVALGITKVHLERQTERGEIGRAVFIVPTVELVSQQCRQYRTYLSSYQAYGMSGDIQDSQKVPLGELVPKYDIIVMTPQIMVDALNKQTLENIGCFTLMIFDECHHATKQHPYNMIMKFYLEEKLSGQERSFILPQVVGLTASVGVGKARDIPQAVDHILALCGNLDCDGIVTVEKEKSQLRKFVNTPEENKVETMGRKQDPFASIINRIMDTIELRMKRNPLLREVPENQSLDRYLVVPSARGGDPYTQWISRLEKPVARIHEQRLRRPFHACILQLKVYNNSLRINADCRTKDAVDFLVKELKEIEIPHKDETDNALEQLLAAQKHNLNLISEDRTFDNPKLLELEKIILTHEMKNPDMRAIIFCKTRALTLALQNWMKESTNLKHLNPNRVTGGAANAEKGGMTQNQQEDVLKFFKDGKHKVIVATSVAEEGLDVSKCDLVVRYEYVTNEIAMIQARGRGRAEDSKYIALGERGRGLAEKEDLNKVRESMMNKAILKLKDLPDQQRQKKILEFQRQAMVEWEMMEAGRLIKDRERLRRPHGDWVLRCIKCDELCCFHTDIRVVEKSHHFVVDDTFHERIIIEKHPDPKSYAEFVKTDKIFCKRCRYDWGIRAVYKGAKFPVIKLSSFVVINSQYNQRDVYKKWKDAPFHVDPLTPDDLQKHANQSMEQADD